MNERVGACGELVGERWEGRRVCESARAGDRVGGGDGRVWGLCGACLLLI